jgi:hypothetical protein
VFEGYRNLEQCAAIQWNLQDMKSAVTLMKSVMKWNRCTGVYSKCVQHVSCVSTIVNIANDSN